MALLAIGLMAIFTLTTAGQARSAPVCKLHEVLHLPVTMVGTQPTVPVKINGKDSRFLVDSGAFFSIITPGAATRLGLSVKSDARLSDGIAGAGGRAEAKATNVADFALADVPFHHIDLVVANGVGNGIDGLLGENVLGNADVEYDLANGVVRLFKPEHCESQALAYWNPSGASSMELMVNSTDINHHIRALGGLNGQKIRLMFDTGASRSIVTLKAAASAGVSPQTPGANYLGQSSGVGSHLIDTWSVRFDSLKLDREEIQHTRLRIGGVELGDADMLIGADFFLSHRIFVSNSQHRLYFTYSGGPVFQLERAANMPVTPQAADASNPAQDNAPTYAAGFTRRGAAFMARYDYPHAIEDFTRAHDLEPSEAQHLLDRAQARMSSGQPVLAMSDFDAALKLKPGDVAALIGRAGLYARSGDRVHAREDLEQASRLAGSDSAMRLTVAQTYMRDGLWEDGLAQFDRWIIDNPRSENMAGALNNRCYIRAILKADLDKALVDCNASLKKNPGHAETLDSRGLTHLDRAEFDAAIADYDASLRLRPQNAITLYGRGAAKLRKGLKDAGNADIQAAIKIWPQVTAEAKEIGLTP